MAERLRFRVRGIKDIEKTMNRLQRNIKKTAMHIQKWRKKLERELKEANKSSRGSYLK